MLFDRQKQLLALLDSLGGSAGNLDFQKLLLLYCLESGDAPPYEFIPYKFGAFYFSKNTEQEKQNAKSMHARRVRTRGFSAAPVAGWPTGT
jgi:hypothetical protein